MGKKGEMTGKIRWINLYFVKKKVYLASLINMFKKCKKEKNKWAKKTARGRETNNIGEIGHMLKKYYIFVL